MKFYQRYYLRERRPLRRLLLRLDPAGKINPCRAAGCSRMPPLIQEAQRGGFKRATPLKLFNVKTIRNKTGKETMPSSWTPAIGTTSEHLNQPNVKSNKGDSMALRIVFLLIGLGFWFYFH